MKQPSKFQLTLLPDYDTVEVLSNNNRIPIHKNIGIILRLIDTCNKDLFCSQFINASIMMIS